MTEFSIIPDNKELPAAVSPPEPGKRPDTIWRKIYRFLSSSKLAMGLLVAILVSCLIGVTLLRGERAGQLIFNTLWFNGLLVLLVINIAFCFFGRIWGRKVTLISLGMILFHLSFVAMLGGIVFNSLFFFSGLIRLTEGETLPNWDPASYDYVNYGRLFSYTQLKGETTLLRIHRGYVTSSGDKKIAYEMSVGEGGGKKQGVVYVTNHYAYNGVRYFRDKEGYSVLAVIYDRKDSQLYGAYIPLQGLEQKDKGILFTTGTKFAPASTQFPYRPSEPLITMQLSYIPSKLQERSGEVYFQVWPLAEGDKPEQEKPMTEGKVPIGEKFVAGEYKLSVEEVRYWAGITVRYDPGLPIVLTSLWTGLGGMVLTFVGRLRRKTGSQQ